MKKDDIEDTVESIREELKAIKGDDINNLPKAVGLMLKLERLMTTKTEQTKVVYYRKAGVEGGCPICGEPDCRVTGKPSKKVRRHKCKNGHTFKSVER